MEIPQKKTKFVPMRNSFFLLYVSGIFILLAFIASGIWFSRQVNGLSEAVNLAGSERMRTYKIVFLITRAYNETTPAREETLGQVKMEMDRFEEILNALKDGSRKYSIKDVTDEAADARLKNLILEWEQVFKPRLNAILISSPENRKRLLSEYDNKIHAFVEDEDKINGLVALLVKKMNHAERLFMGLRYILTAVGVILIGSNLLYLRRRVLRPINILMRDTEEVTKGNYAVRSEVSTPNELMLLAERFNSMTNAISTSFRTMEETIRKRTEELSVNNARMQSFYDSAPDAILSIKAEDRSILLFSKGAEKMFGYTAEEVIGKNVNMLMPEPYHSNHEQYVKNYLETGVKKIIGSIRVVKGRKKDGTIFDIDLSVSESATSGGRVFNGIIRDISARVAAEGTLVEKNRELELISKYEHTYAKIIELFSSVYDEKAILEGALSALAEEQHYPVSAIYLYDEWSGNLHCAASHGATETLKTDFKLGEGIIGQAATEHKIYFLSGSDSDVDINIETGIVSVKPAMIMVNSVIYQEKIVGVLVLASTKTLADVDGNFINRLSGQIGIALNSLRQYSNLKELSSELKIKGDEITEKNIQLEETNRLKSEFLANMSHELRTPMNAIIGFSEVLKDGLLGQLAEDQKSYVTDIFNSGQHLLSLINDILDLSKIEAGKMILDLEPVDVPSTLENSLSMVKEKAMAHNIRLALDVDAGIGIVQVDARKFKQIIYNLLSNAVKFTPDGGSVSVRARLTRDEGRGTTDEGGRTKDDTRMTKDEKGASIVPASEASGRPSSIEISVTDTGIGIKKEDIGKLFRPFVQIDGSMTRKYEGTGLGLVMVKKLAELHGGSVGVTSEPGKGSVFTVRLPYKAYVEEKGRAEQKTEQKRVTKEQVNESEEKSYMAAEAASSVNETPLVLVVEDNPKESGLLRLYLEDAGYRVMEAANGKMALDAMLGSKPDLITLDLMMPEMDGFTFLDEKSKHAAYAGIPVVIVSGIAGDLTGVVLSANAFLKKPVRRDELLSIVTSLVPKPGKGGKFKILIIDDDPKAITILSTYLTRDRYSLVKAYGGQEGLEAAAANRPDLIVLDLMMPEMNGFEVLDRLRSNEETRGTPVVVLTAKILTSDERKMLSSKVQMIVEKGRFHKDVFLREVRSLISKKQEG